MVDVAKITRPGFTWTLVLGLVGAAFLGASAHAQQMAPLNLETPILPDGMVMSPGVADEIVMDNVVGSSVNQGVVQTGFTGCTACGSIGCSGCSDYSGPGFSCPPASLGIWLRADYLAWYEKDGDTIPLVTSSSGIPANNRLLTLGAPETRVEFGGEYSDDPLEGYRIEAGAWMDASHTRGIMGRYFEVGDRSVSFSAGPNDFNFLGIPFFNTDIGGTDGPGEDALTLTVPNERNGQVAVSITGDVRSWEILMRQLSETGCNYRRDWLIGYRNFSFDETLSINASTLITNPPDGSNVPAGTLSEVQDRFDIENRFHGLDIGMAGNYHQGRWSMDYLAKVALGIMTSDVAVSGQTVNTVTGFSPFNLEGGLFSQETNIGSHDESNFAVIPEVNLNLGYGVTQNLDFTVGYTFILVSRVTRAGTMDRAVDEGLLFDLDPINSNRPEADFGDDVYFLHGLNIGMTGRF